MADSSTSRLDKATLLHAADIVQGLVCAGEAGEIEETLRRLASTLPSESGEREHFPPCPPCGTPDTCFAQRWCMDTGHPVNAARVPEDRKARDGGALPTVSTPAAAPSSSDKTDDVRAAIERLRNYPDGSYLRCVFCATKNSQHAADCPIEVVARAVTPSHVGQDSEEILSRMGHAQPGSTVRDLRRITGLNDHDRELVQHAADLIEVLAKHITPSSSGSSGEAVVEACAAMCDKIKSDLRGSGLEQQAFGAGDCASNLRFHHASLARSASGMIGPSEYELDLANALEYTAKALEAMPYNHRDTDVRTIREAITFLRATERGVRG